MGLKFQHFLFFILFWHFFENFSILEVEIGRNGPGILGVKHGYLLIELVAIHTTFVTCKT
jgi:hypothetical protein